MNLVVGSCFRESSRAHVERYALQVARLFAAAQARGDRLHLISVWGDSPAETPGLLGLTLGALALPSWHLLERSHGFPNYGSSTHPDRLSGFAYAANGVFETVGTGADVVVYVESDLLWTPEDLYAGIAQLDGTHQLIALPTFCVGTDTFYDIWAFRSPRGDHFGPFAPYWSGLDAHGLTQIQSAGGCLVMQGVVARDFRCSPDEALVGFCKVAAQFKVPTWTDWTRRVWHP